MAQPYHNSTSLYEEQHCQLFNFDQTFSSLSLSCPVFVNDHHPPQVQGHSYFIEAPQHFQLQLQADQMVPFVDQSCDLHSATTADENQSDHQYHDSLKLNSSWKSSDELIERNEILKDGTDHHENIINSSNKWKMMMYPTVVQITNSDMPAVNYTTHKFENTKKYPTSSLPATDQIINNNLSFTSSGNNNSTTTTTTTTIRVCVDCNTTKTPLWRSGPRGPKTLCNACGIRQRKARRAMAAAAGSGTIIRVDKSSKKGRSSTVQKKESKAIKNKNNNISCLPFKKRCKLNSPSTRGRKKNQVGSNFEELAIRINKNISAYQLSVFPQDEKEAAILLMALSYGLVNG